MENTIVAISTAAGNSGIGIIRLSGKNSFEIVKKIFVPKNKQQEIKGYSIKYGNIINPENSEIIDEVLVSYFIGPNSFTREDMCEINTHGGMVVERKILDICLKNGADLAEPGEFTKRAFLNGRIDLAQAESVIDLINAKSDKEAKESIKGLKGELSEKIGQIEEKITDVMVNIEVVVDYPEYDIDEMTNKEALEKLAIIENMLEELEHSFDKGKLIRDGIKTVIFGKPNAGKSSLLNAILNEDRAIVSEIEGTTRDSIEEYINVGGLALKLIDTAGVRKTDNIIEKIGVDKSKKLAEESDLIIAIFDLSKDLEEEDKQIIDIIRNKNAIIVLNKVDIKKESDDIENQLTDLCKPIIKMSALKREGLEDLYNEIIKIFSLNEILNSNDILITNERHKNQIRKAKESIKEGIEAIKNSMPIDISSIHIKQALNELGEITGKNASEDIINEIFRKFCLGK